ncbi:hypothetical protein [Ammoniphilus sp. CFH 90114]|uniref:hypothetical protein n=1 Tax=Ammoniphilus sp. CFH 90114 TaxID=2493665 RepID=UPI00100EE4B6|nr:hypothetical protein [Ammoniphilus sp. CFH 90114]RXT15459.1 hypothetical protein EIZ39_04495 [Ammoniphilus sp. CFH 90114]
MKRKANSYPFIILLIIHTVLLLFTFYKQKDRKTLFVLLFSNIGIAYIFEYFVFSLFQAYRYKPRFFKDNTVDNTSGAILSQAIYVPFTALFLTAFQWRDKAKWVGSLYFTMVEMMFLRLGVYQHNWWRTPYTTILIPIYFYISDWWYKQIKQGTPVVLTISLFNMIMVTGTNLLYVMALVGKFRFGMGPRHTWTEHYKISPLYPIVHSFFATWSLKREGIVSKFRILVFGNVLDWVLFRSRIVDKKFYQPLINNVLHIFMIVTSNLYKRLVDDHKKSQ